MDQQKSKSIKKSEKGVYGKKTQPRSLGISERGIHTGSQFAGLMSALMGDIISGRVTPAVGNATCNAGGKLLKIVEMQYKYGTQGGNQGARILTLAPEEGQ